MEIVDGTGRGYRAKVTSENMLRVYAKVESEISHSSESNAEAYSWTAATTDIDINDTMIYLSNQSTTKNLIIQGLLLWSDVASEIDIGFPTTYVIPAGGAVVTGTNLNRKSGNAADAICRADETANSIVDLLMTCHSPTATNEWDKHVDFWGSIILGYHDAIQIDLKTEPGAYNCTIFGYFHTVE